MTKLPALRFVPASVLVLAVTLGAQSNTEEFARRQYESGLTFLQNHRYAEALKDFQAVIDSFSDSSVADKALLQIALYRLEITHDAAAAQTVVDRLLKDYPNAGSAPMAHVVAGRLALAKGHAPADVDAALASFERVPRLFPGDDAVSAAGFYTGDTLQRARRHDEALDRFRRVAAEYPQSIWAARATLAAGLCLVQSDRALRALEEVQRVRQRFPGSAEAADALNYNSILYRLYVRPPAQPPYTFSGRYVGGDNARFKDVVGVTIDATGRLLLGHKLGISIFDGKAALSKNISADSPSAFFVDERGRIVVARRDVLVAEGAESTAVAMPLPDGKTRPIEEMASIVALSSGDRLVADRKGKAVIRLSPAGRYLGNFATVNAERLALNWLDDVAMIDRDSKAIVLADRDGKPLGKVPAKGTGYEFDNPVDLKFDVFGHLYVLDRGRASVFVFGPKYKLITTVTIPEKNPGAFQKAQAVALDAAGRLHIYDDRAQRIQVYQ